MIRQIELLGQTVYGCGCELCQHIWMAITPPKRCSKCKSMKWNAGKEVPSEPAELSARDTAMTASGGRVPEAVSNLGGSIAGWMTREAGVGFERFETAPEDGGWPKPVAELEDTAEPYRASEKPKKRAVGETLASSLCRHQLYAGTCPRCKYGTM